MTPLKVAVIGTGALGRHHARILAAIDGVQLAFVVEIDEERGRQVAQQSGATWVNRHQPIIDQVAAVVVASPTRSHCEIAADFLSRGRDVLVEKPIAANVAEAARLATLARENQVILQVGHIERFNPALTAARAHLSEPRYIRAERYSPYAFRSIDIGVVHDVMIHDIDLVLSLARSTVDRVEAFGASIMGENEDCVQARVYFANGCIADLAASRVSPVARRDMQVWSAEGCVHLDFAAREATVYSRTPTLLYGVSPLDRARERGTNLEALRAEVFGTYLHVNKPSVTPCDPLTEELRSFVECVRTRRAPVVGGDEALAAMDVADQVLGRVAAHRWDESPSGRVGPFLKQVAAQKLAG
ncbi:MAG: Gfo/Idh/MocA family oxidoreductase [Planctomycetaceae bacterium]